MTTTQQFEEQKREIKEGIRHSIRLNLDGLTTRVQVVINDPRWIFDAIDALKPPKPTCLTCKHYNWDGFDSQCTNSKINEQIQIEDIKSNEFGCIMHSDYEANN